MAVYSKNNCVEQERERIILYIRPTVPTGTGKKRDCPNVRNSDSDGTSLDKTLKRKLSIPAIAEKD